MSTYVLMRLLESAPRRYELGIRILTLGRLERSYARLARNVKYGQSVLDVGCGTGLLTLRVARQGANVKAIDINAGMLKVAEQCLQEAGLEESVNFVQMGVAELDGEAAESYDAVTSGLCLSELSEDELAYTLNQVMRVLKPGGILLVADEAEPRSPIAWLLHWLLRAPLLVITYLFTQQTTHPIANLATRLTSVGLSVTSIKSSRFGGLSEFVAQKPLKMKP